MNPKTDPEAKSRNYHGQQQAGQYLSPGTAENVQNELIISSSKEDTRKLSSKVPNEIRTSPKSDMIPMIVVNKDEQPQESNQNPTETLEKSEDFRGGLAVINNKCEKRSSFSRMAILRQKQQAEEDNKQYNYLKNNNNPKVIFESDQIEEKQNILEGATSSKNNISNEDLAKARGAIRKLSLRSKTMKDQVNLNLNILGDISPYISLRAEGSPFGMDGTWSKRHGTMGSNNILSNSQLNAFQESPISLVNKNDQSCNFASDTTYQEDFISEQLLHPSLSKMPGNQVLDQYQSPKEVEPFVQEEDNEEEEEDGETVSNFINLYKNKGNDSYAATPQKNRSQREEGEVEYLPLTDQNAEKVAIVCQNSNSIDQQKITRQVQSQVDSKQKLDNLPNKKNQQAHQLVSTNSEKSTASSSSKQDSNNRSQSKLSCQPTPSKDQQQQEQRIQQQSMYYMQPLKQTSSPQQTQQNKSDSHKNSSKEHMKSIDFSDSSKGKITTNSGRQTVSSSQMNSMFSLGGKSVPCLSQFFEQSGNRNTLHSKIPQYFSQKSSLTDIPTIQCLESEKDNLNHNNNDYTKTPQQSQETSETSSKKPNKPQKSHQNSEQIISKKPITVSLENTSKHQPSIHQHLALKSSAQHDSIQRIFSLQDPSSKADETATTNQRSAQGNNIHKQSTNQPFQINNNNNSSPGSKYTLSMIANELSKSSRNTAQLLTKNQYKPSNNNTNNTPQTAASTATTQGQQKSNFKGKEAQGSDADTDKNKIKQVSQILMVNLSKTKSEFQAQKRKSQAQISDIQTLNRAQRTKSLNEEAKKASQSHPNLLETAKNNLDSLFKSNPLLSSFEHPPSQTLKSDADSINSEQKSPKAMKIISLQDQIQPSYSQIHAKNHLNQISAFSESGMKIQSRRESLATCPMGISTDLFKELLPVKGNINYKDKPQIIELAAKQNNINTITKQNGQHHSRFTAPSTPAKLTNTAMTTGNNFNSQSISNSAGYAPPSPVSASQFQQISSKISKQTPTLSTTPENISKQLCISPKQSQKQTNLLSTKAVFESISLSSSKSQNKNTFNGQNKTITEDQLHAQTLSGTYYAKRKSGINFKQISQLS